MLTEAKPSKFPKVFKCKNRSDFCTKEYKPVCGYKPDIMCITTPCNYITYSNACEACQDEDVESYTQGTCKESQSIPPVKPVPIDPVITKCTKESRKGDACPAVYSPVCGYKPDIFCITTPCNYITYGNPCEACHDKDVASYTPGECPPEPSLEEPEIFETPKPKPQVTKCTKESREGDACFDIYQPVCGFKPDIFCITTPCNYITYANSCEACHDEDVESYTQGECEYDIPVKVSSEFSQASKSSHGNKRSIKKSVKFLGKKSD